MWIFDKLFNRKIEGKSSLDNLEQLAGKVGYEGDKVKINDDVEVEGLTSKGIANTGAFANIGDVAVSGDGSFSGDVVVKTIKQTQATKSFDISYSANLPSGITELETAYKKCVQLGNVLWLIIETSYSNGTESPIDMGNLGFDIELDEDTASKIYKYDGYTVHEYESGQSATICREVGVVGTSVRFFNVGTYRQDHLQPYINIGSISAGGSSVLSVRIPIILI